MNSLVLTLVIVAALVAVNLFIIRWFKVTTAIRSRADAQAAAQVESLKRASRDAAAPALADAA